MFSGEMGRLIRGFDWSATPLGPMDRWPQSLRTAVSIMLGSRYPMFVWWGPALVNFYNDAYAPMLGKRHPSALGRSAFEVWSDVWPVCGPQAEAVLQEGKSTWNEELLLIVERNGFPEEAYFTFSYSPILDDAGMPGGVFCAVTEETARVLGRRRLKTLRDLGERALLEATTDAHACQAGAKSIAENLHDFSFALLYLRDPQGGSCRLCGAVNYPRGQRASPDEVTLGGSDDVWDFQQVLEANKARVVEDLHDRFGFIPAGRWKDDSTRRALVAPLAKAGVQELPAGFLVAGLSPRLEFDDEYRGFLELAAGHIATAIANARAYQEERRRAEALAELDRAKTAFFSNVSHEFRTPLALMLGTLEELLSEGNASLSPEAREQLAVSHRNSLRLLKLVNTLLDFSRIEAGRAEANYEPTPLAEFTAGLCGVFRAMIEKAGLRFRVECPPLAEPVWVDREMWEKIVLNLLSNSFKFTFEGEIAVQLAALDGVAELRVRDTGIGIPEAELDNIFKRFHRVEGARGRTFEGSGIGLALVQELVKLHGGSISAKSSIGAGAEFVVSIPLGRAHLPKDRVRSAQSGAGAPVKAEAFVEEARRWLPASSEEGSRSFGAAGSSSMPSRREGGGPKPCVLVADDNADMREYVRRLLAADFDVVTATDGESALASARQARPDLILTDIMMPRLDGFGLLRAIRADPRLQTIPVILLSARAGEESRVDGLGAGADDYLIKPFGARELAARVESHLKMARFRQDAFERERALRGKVSESQEQLAAELRATKLLYELGNDLAAGGRAFDQCLERVVDVAIAVAGADKGNLQILDPQSGALRIAAQRGFESEFLSHFADVHAETGAACGAAMQARRRIVIEDIARSEVFGGSPSLEVMLRAGARAVQSTPLVSSAGNLLGMISTHCRKPRRPSERELRMIDLLARQAADFLERRQVEEALRQSETRMRTIAESLPNLVWTALPDGICDWLSNQWRRYTGLPEEELLGFHWLDRTVHPEDRERTKACWRAACEDRGEYDLEYRIRRHDGQYRWFKTRGVPIRGERGEIAGWFGTCTDIEEMKRAEAEIQRLAAIVEHSEDAIFSTDLDGAIRSWNRGAARLYGYSGEEVIGRPIALLIPEELLDQERSIAASVREGQSVENCETQRLRKDGSRFDVSLTVSPVKDRSGRIVGISKVARDISDKVRAKEKLEQTVAERTASLREAVAQMEEFSYSVSHDLRSPVRAIQGYAKALAEDFGDQLGGEAARFLDRIIQASSRMERLIHDVLTYSRAGRVEMKLQPVSLDNLVRGILNEYPELGADRADIVLEPNLPAVLAHESSLRQAVANLLNNAVKFVAPGIRPKVRVSSERKDGQVTLRIRDNGIGIAPGHQGRLFGMFERIHPEGKYEGTGIGLAIVRKTVERMGGKAGVESDGTNGSTFWIRLPEAPKK